MVRSPLRLAFLTLSLAALSACPAGALSDRAVLERYDLSAADLSPASAEILKDTSYLSQLRSLDSKKADNLTQRKSVLKDLEHLLKDYDNPDDPDGTIRAIRDALRSETQDLPVRSENLTKMGLGPEPEKLCAWVARYFGERQKSLFQRAVWSWPALSNEQRRWLALRQVPETRWNELSFRGRDSHMENWAYEKAKRLLEALEAAPDTATREAFANIWNKEVEPKLVHADGDRLRRKARDLYVLKKYSAAAKSDSGILSDPKLRSLLDRASDAGASPEDRLAALSQIYDRQIPRGAKPGSSAVLRERLPPGPGQSLSEHDRGTLQDMLPGAYMKEIRGTEGGDSLVDFYADARKHPLKVRIPPADPKQRLGTLAYYNPDDQTISYRVEEVEKWLRIHRVTANELLVNRDGAFDRFVQDSAPIFVHEGVHHMQDAAVKIRGLPSQGNQRIEVNARFLESAYIAEKLSRSASFRERALRNRDAGGYASAMIDQVKSFYAGPRRLNQETMINDYSETPSSDFAVAEERSWDLQYTEVVAAELSRRQNLAIREQSTLRNDGLTMEDLDRTGWGEPAEFRQKARSYRTPVLDYMARNLKDQSFLRDAEHKKRDDYSRELDAQESALWFKIARKAPANYEMFLVGEELK